jgi:hypothetical protein
MSEHGVAAPEVGFDFAVSSRIKVHPSWMDKSIF